MHEHALPELRPAPRAALDLAARAARARPRGRCRPRSSPSSSSELVRDPFVDRTLTDRLRPAAADRARPACIRIAQEQAPNPDSRVTLGDERDAFGLRRVALDWRLAELDVAHHAHRGRRPSARTSPSRTSAAPGSATGCSPTRRSSRASPTTRSAASTTCAPRGCRPTPQDGVVDADCRVHGITNLYIGGSSVFATTGHCNPTYTIVQLALRLGDHLGGWLRRLTPHGESTVAFVSCSTMEVGSVTTAAFETANAARLLFNAPCRTTPTDAANGSRSPRSPKPRRRFPMPRPRSDRCEDTGPKIDRERFRHACRPPLRQIY